MLKTSMILPRRTITHLFYARKKHGLVSQLKFNIDKHAVLSIINSKSKKYVKTITPSPQSQPIKFLK